MSDILMVPIHLDALYLQRDTFVAEAVADFTRLPYFNGQRDVNPDIANISEDIVIEPFQDKNFNLKSGLHLHWALPDALTSAIDITIVEKQTFKKAFGDGADGGDEIWNQLIDEQWIKEIDSSKASVMPIDQRTGNDLGIFEDRREAIEAILSQPIGTAFPPVPNRWLVERRGGGNELPDRAWVIESDYLYLGGEDEEDGEDGEDSDPGSANILYSAELFSGGNTEAIGTLASHLKDSTPPALSDWLQDRFLENTKNLLSNYTSGTPSSDLQKALMWELNKIMWGASIYSEERFYEIELSAETQNLLDSHPQDEDLVRLNRLLLEAAYPECKGIGHQPFRYLGRNMPLGDWLNELYEGRLYKEYLAPLTAIGYGEPTFAAFYPNCYSVFGFYDGEVKSLPAEDSDLKYTVVGWYDSDDRNDRNDSDRNDSDLTDYFATFLKHYRNLYQGKGEPSNADLLDAIQNEFEWTLEIPEDKEFPGEMLCYARIGFAPEANPENSYKDSATTIAVGNTSTEALSAYLAREIDPDYKPIIEDQLECLHLFAGLEHRQLDLGPKFEEARHENGFNALNAGILWTIRYDTDSDRKADAAKSNAQEQVSLPEEIADPLNTLNLKQQEYDRALQEIESLQYQIFADWYKYMLCAYPPDDSRDDYPNIDEVKQYIQVKGIDQLNEKVKATGELRLLVDPTSQNLVLRRDGEGNVITAAASEADSEADSSELAAAINDLLNRLDTYNRELRNSIIEDRILDSLDNNSDILRGSPIVVAESPLGNCLSFDGTDDYIQLSGLTNAKAVSLWVNIPSQQQSGDRYLLDAPGLNNGQVAATIEDVNNQISHIGADWNIMYADGTEVGKRLGDLPLWQEIPKDRWVHIYLEAKTAFDGDIYIMSDRNGQNKLKAKLAVVRAYNRDLTEEEIDRDRSNTIDINYILKRIASPRYWQPNEPAILIEGDAAQFTERHGSDGSGDDDLLECQFYENSDNKAIADLIGSYDDTIGPKIDAIEKENSDSIAFSTWRKQPWNPFLLEWEVEVLPIENNNNLQPDTRAYDSDFILSNYDLEENATDLSVKPGKSSTRAANVYSGSAIVTPDAGIKLGEELEGYLNEKNVLGSKSVMEQYFADTGETPSDDYLSQPDNVENVKGWYEHNYLKDSSSEEKAKDPIYTAIRAYQLLLGSNSFSQALGGFNAGLLMQKQTMQLRIDDPLGFEEYKSFAERVRLAVGDRSLVAPVPLNDFNPIRSGVMSILRLRLMDTFGQVKADLDPQQLVVTEKMTPPPGCDDLLPSGNGAYLPPRLVQPSRLNFRWLSASQGEQESNSHPATSPICGWLLPNNLDNSLMVYDSLGNTLGSVDREANWEPAPGSNVQVELRDIANPYLRKVVARLTVELSDADEVKIRKADFINNLITVIDSSLENIEPENFAQHQDLALLMGSPVAVVRASLNLELQGLPSINHGWNEFRQDLTRDERDTDNFTQVQFPIRIGEYQQLNDGTIGYWQEGEDGSLSDDFYAVHNYDDDEVEDEQIKTENLCRTIGDRPQNLTLLMDPRGKVHATSGVLPSKAIDLPPDYYTEALNNIEITFLSVPILAETYQIKLPLPKEAGYAWSWLEKNRYTWQEISTIGRIRKEVILAEFDDGPEVWERLIQQGWIVELDLIQAVVVPTDQRTDASLGEDMQDKEPKIERILARSHIGAIDLNATFGDTQEIREGWLKLRKVML